MNTTYKCPNCGAEMDKREPKCPFCGYINEEGAERQYMEKLDDVRERLDNVDEEAAEEYGKSYKKIIRIILVTVVTLLVLTVIGTAIYKFVENKTMELGNSSGEDVLKEMSWQKEHFVQYDELYEAEKYEELVDIFFSKETEDHNLYDYKHYRFVCLYHSYLDTKIRLARVDAEGWSDADATAVMYDSFTFYYETFAEGYDKLDDDELARLQPVTDYMKSIVYDRLGYTDADMEKLRDRVMSDYGNIEYDKCSKVVKGDLGKYK